jgi:hypothetical protein
MYVYILYIYIHTYTCWKDDENDGKPMESKRFKWTGYQQIELISAIFSIKMWGVANFAWELTG